MLKTLKNFFDQDKKDLNQMMKTVAEINELEETYSSLSDEDLKEKTNELKEQAKNGESLEELLVEAFALVREASKRTLGLRHFDVQLLGGIVLFKGNIAEMKTGEGKTLVATLPAYLYALTGKGVHVYTVNDYLARRDAEWMKPVYDFLGLTVGHIRTNSSYEERTAAYKCDITYGTSNEFGFDYLRSNMVKDQNHILISNFHYAIVDEADTILIDEARVPLSLSDLDEEVSEDYYEYVKLIEHLEQDVHFELEPKQTRATLTEDGIVKIEELLGIDNLYSAEHIMKVNKIQYSLIAKFFLEKDKNYVVDEDRIVMIDSFTGRLMPGRRFADGIQQAIEAKEGVSLSPEYIVKGTTTYQNLLRKYEKVAGMSGTAKTEETEFTDSYGLYVYSIPTHHELKREDSPDVIYKTKEAKYKAILEEVKEVHALGRPILIGTTSVEESEEISTMLKENELEHHVLNARNHSKEAEIIANAGEKDSITVITNMAGRGTDIKLGEGISDIGGLHVIGTTRHENRRIDNQLRGRAGRQGDNGTTRIFVSLEDDLVQRYGGEQVRIVLNKIRISDDMPVEHPLAGKLVEQMQIQSESSASGTRKFVKMYDDILNNQRDVLYQNRQQLLTSNTEEVKEQLFAMYQDVITAHVHTYCEEEVPVEEWDLESVLGSLNRFYFPEDQFKVEDIKGIEDRDEIVELFYNKAVFVYERKEKHVDKDAFASFIRELLLTIIDKNWVDHMSTMDYLRQGLGMKGKVGNPFLDFSIEALDLFDQMVFSIKEMSMLNTILLEIQLESPQS